MKKKCNHMSHVDLKLIYNDIKGYSLKGNLNIDLNGVSQIIEQDITNISYNKKSVTFSTDLFNSLNNRLSETEL